MSLAHSEVNTEVIYLEASSGLVRGTWKALLSKLSWQQNYSMYGFMLRSSEVRVVKITHPSVVVEVSRCALSLKPVVSLYNLPWPRFLSLESNVWGECHGSAGHKGTSWARVPSFRHGVTSTFWMLVFHIHSTISVSKILGHTKRDVFDIFYLFWCRAEDLSLPTAPPKQKNK